MSAADDNKALLAMKAARMSTSSIAFTMGWSGKRVERRLAELEAAEAEAEKRDVQPGFVIGSLNGAAVPIRPVTPERSPQDTNPVRTPTPRPARPARAADGVDGVVTRTFQTRDGCGAAVRLEDGRLVFTETGTEDPRQGAAVHVRPAAGCFQMIGEAARG